MDPNAKGTPAVSVLIPTRNGGKTLAELLSMLSLQTIEFCEILVIDSASEDNTVEIAKSYGADVSVIDPDDFDHGGTRTILAQRARGDILVFFTQDAIPKRRNSVEKLIEPILQNGTVATSYGRQLPAFDANHFATSLRYFNYSAKGAVRELKDKQRWGLKVAFTSNSFAGYRRVSLEKIGFFKSGLIFGEDTVAAGKLLLGGEKIAYVPEATVYHSHNYSPVEEFRRYFDIGVLHASEKWLLETFGNAEKLGVKYLQYELDFLISQRRISLVFEMLLRVLLKYLGYKLGRNHKRLPKKIVPWFYMNRSWCED